MEEKEKLIESLLEKSIDYGKTSFELVKLKVLDKTSNVVSSFIPHSAVFFLVASFMLFLNLGLALWIGELLEKTYLGFFVVAGFYFIVGVIIHVFLHKWLKRTFRDYIIKQVLK
ncbi:MAG: hypothetical protein IPH84_01740 [Bacteroidales bacterium]|nr:hypothetical protein [Bacteroidales bacterium]